MEESHREGLGGVEERRYMENLQLLEETPVGTRLPSWSYAMTGTLGPTLTSRSRRRGC